MYNIHDLLFITNWKRIIRRHSSKDIANPRKNWFSLHTNANSYIMFSFLTWQFSECYIKCAFQPQLMLKHAKLNACLSQLCKLEPQKMILVFPCSAIYRTTGCKICTCHAIYSPPVPNICLTCKLGTKYSVCQGATLLRSQLEKPKKGVEEKPELQNFKI